MDGPQTKLKIISKRNANKEDAVHHTNYLITINSNVHYQDLGEAGVRQWQEAIKNMWSDAYPLLRVPPNVTGYGPNKNLPAKNKIDGIDVSIAFEIGPETGMLHAHGTISVKHHTRVQLNLKLIHAILEEFFPAAADGSSHKQYFSAKLIAPGAMEITENYLNKPDTLISKFSS